MSSFSIRSIAFIARPCFSVSSLPNNSPRPVGTMFQETSQRDSKQIPPTPVVCKIERIGYFLPLPHGHGALGEILGAERRTVPEIFSFDEIFGFAAALLWFEKQNFTRM